MKILLLGSKGMLGSDCYTVLSKDFDVMAEITRFQRKRRPESPFTASIQAYERSVVIFRGIGVS